MWRIFFLAHLGLSVADPDLQITGQGREGGRPVIYTLTQERGLVSKTSLFSVLRASVWSKNKGLGPGPPMPLPWIRNSTTQETFAEVLLTDFISFQKCSLQPFDRQRGKA